MPCASVASSVAERTSMPPGSKKRSSGSPGWQVTISPSAVTAMPGCAQPAAAASGLGSCAQSSIQRYRYAPLPTSTCSLAWVISLLRYVHRAPALGGRVQAIYDALHVQRLLGLHQWLGGTFDALEEALEAQEVALLPIPSRG